jgi:hypothetical protein
VRDELNFNMLFGRNSVVKRWVTGDLKAPRVPCDSEDKGILLARSGSNSALRR